jgi:hypothetical protein
MGFSSVDDFLNKVTVSNKFLRTDWNKLVPLAMVAGQSHYLGTGLGNPSIQTVLGTGTNLAFRTLTGGGTTNLACTYSVGGTTSCIITIPGGSVNNFIAGMSVTVDFTSGTAPDGTYIVSAVALTTITITLPSAITTSGNVNVVLNHGGIYHGANVSPDTKHLINASIYSGGGTTAPVTAILVDVLGFYPIRTLNPTTLQNLDNTVTLSRYTDGAGVNAFLATNISPTSGTGPTIEIRYTNSANVSNRVPEGTISFNGFANATASTIVYSGNGANKFNPFIPLASGDAGIRSVQSIQLTGGTYNVGAVANLILCKPLVTLPISTVGIPAERDLFNQVPSLPRIYDGANLQWLIYASVAVPVNSTFLGHLDFAWG